MKPKQLERKFTFSAEFNYCLLAFLPVVVIASLIARTNRGLALLLAVLVLVGTICWLVYRHLSFEEQLDEHQATLSNLAATHSWQLQTYQTEQEIPAELDNTSLLLIADRDQQLVNYLLTPDWNYIDFSYCVYEQTKNGEYKSALVYYSVLVTKLPRILPNIFFDSKSQGGRQYKTQFDTDQRQSLEGDFDTYFDTYFAEGYTIDSMSFITPDVMQALEAASEYDIEIMGDRLLLYGPVYVDARKVIDGAAKLQAILKTLQVTARAYDDERLPGLAGRQTVTPQGLQLRRKSPAGWIAIIVVSVYILLSIWK